MMWLRKRKMSVRLHPTSVFLLSTEGSLLWVYLALYLGGTPSTSTGTRSPSCIRLENCLYIFKKPSCKANNPDACLIWSTLSLINQRLDSKFLIFFRKVTLTFFFYLFTDNNWNLLLAIEEVTQVSEKQNFIVIFFSDNFCYWNNYNVDWNVAYPLQNISLSYC